MDQVMTDLGGAESIIVDVRLNGGGFDKVGMAIANRFTDKKRLAFTKHARHGDEVTPKQQFFIEPCGDYQFTRPVFLLTSARTASAGDIFAMCMRNLQHVTLVGQPSTGILSDNLKKHLPNGWSTSISNEFYCSAEGELFEGPGVPVDEETPVFRSEGFRAGYHIAVDRALELASGLQKVATHR
jgi:C-terminal processing protease CtpA/Prc